MLLYSFANFVKLATFSTRHCYSTYLFTKPFLGRCICVKFYSLWPRFAIFCFRSRSLPCNYHWDRSRQCICGKTQAKILAAYVNDDRFRTITVSGHIIHSNVVIQILVSFAILNTILVCICSSPINVDRCFLASVQSLFLLETCGEYLIVSFEKVTRKFSSQLCRGNKSRPKSMSEVVEVMSWVTCAGPGVAKSRWQVIPPDILHVESIEIFLPLPQPIEDSSPNHVVLGRRKWLKEVVEGRSGGVAAGAEESKNEGDDVRIIVLLVDHINLRPRRELHIVVRASETYKRVSIHCGGSHWPACSSMER